MPTANRIQSISFALLYGCVSVATTIFTKIVVSTFEFKYTAVLVLLEKLSTILFIYISSDKQIVIEAFQLITKTRLLSMVSLLNALVSITSLEGKASHEPLACS
jgi:hypothetical protein